jgi:hypothetical protein
MTTLDLARRYGADTLLKNARTKQFFKISDYSPSTGHVFGWPTNNLGEVISRYQELPATGLELG